MDQKILPILTASLVNLWIWKVFAFSIPLGILLLVTTFYLWSIVKNAEKGPRFSFFIILFSLLLIIQWGTTQKTSLVYLDNDEQRVQQTRLREYPPISFKIGGKTFWIPLAHWLEGRNESVAFTRIQKHIFENLDINQYFFSNHPRQRVGFKEFEKFPYLFLPFFLIGMARLLLAKQKKSYLWLFVLPFLLSGLIGNKNPLGLFSVFPFFACATGQGLQTSSQFTTKFSQNTRRRVKVIFYVLLLLVFIQIISYEIQ